MNLKLLQKNKESFKKVILIKQLIQRHWFFLFSLLMFPQASCLGNTHPMSLLLSSQLSFYYKPGDSWSAAKITKGDRLLWHRRHVGVKGRDFPELLVQR